MRSALTCAPVMIWSRARAAFLSFAAALLMTQASAAPLTRQDVAARVITPTASPTLKLQARIFPASISGEQISSARVSRARISPRQGSRLQSRLAVLRDATLVDADLREASLFASVLANAKLNGANLRGARLMGNMERANLEGADLSEVKGSSDMANQPMGLVRLVLAHAAPQGRKAQSRGLVARRPELRGSARGRLERRESWSWPGPSSSAPISRAAKSLIGRCLAARRFTTQTSLGSKASPPCVGSRAPRGASLPSSSGNGTLRHRRYDGERLGIRDRDS